VHVAGILVTVPFELCFSEISVVARRDILQSDLFVDTMFFIDIFLKYARRRWTSSVM
jgi:hypothetical protein